MQPNSEELEKRLEKSVEFHLGKWLDWYDKHPEAGYDALQAKTQSGSHIIDRSLMAAFLALRAEKRTAKDNKRLQTWLIIFAAISAFGVIVQIAQAFKL